jgi:flagellar hook assembly protein FlgD
VFPNPFDEDIGAFFTFLLSTPSPADVQIRVYTLSGRLIYQRTETGLRFGQHQLAWNGLDDEGAQLANGTYVYKLFARNGTSHTTHEGLIVKLRRPRRFEEPEPSSSR